MYIIDKNLIQKLKKTNVSKDGEKTKIRFKELWKTATREQKAQIMDTADVVRATIYRIYSTGVVSAKIVIAASQAVDVDPLYLTGESDAPGSFSAEAARGFLIDRGYEKLIKKYPSFGGTPANEDNRVKAARRAMDPPPADKAPSPGGAEAPVRLSEEEAVVLLRALVIRSKKSAEAQKKLDDIVAVLLD